MRPTTILATLSPIVLVTALPLGMASHPSSATASIISARDTAIDLLTRATDGVHDFVRHAPRFAEPSQSSSSLPNYIIVEARSMVDTAKETAINTFNKSKSAVIGASSAVGGSGAMSIGYVVARKKGWLPMFLM